MLTISEQFYSIQGEGKTAGIPAVFLRLRSCNLLCEWPCDTIEVWKQGEPWTFENLLSAWEKNGWTDALRKGAHLVITGGEPLLQQDELVKFLALLPHGLLIEVETNATIIPKSELDHYISLYNVSPKTSNSGLPRERRYIPDTIEYFARNSKSIFKFVTESPADVDEILRDFISPFSIIRQRVFLMPQCTDRKGFIEKSGAIADMCKEYHLNFSPRLQLLLWDKTTGV